MKASRLVRMASDVVAGTQRELPPDIREAAKTVPVRLEDAPSPELLAEGFEADILGLFSGAPHGSAEAGPPQIYLYMANLWDFAGEEESAFREEVRLTYLHELGHYLGWDEDQLSARGLD
jgi:predicted Zn-dependent protease with MMP-like domain